MSLPLDELMHRLNGLMTLMSTKMSWDSPRAFRKIGDPSGCLWLGFLGHQPTIRVAASVAEEYMEWLEAGNSGTIMKWAKETGKRLK